VTSVSGLTEEAVREAERIEFEGVPAKVFRAENPVAIAATWDGRRTRRGSNNSSSRPTSTKRSWKKSFSGIN
jgi:hypothetical protein